MALSDHHPLLYATSVWRQRALAYLEFGVRRFASSRNSEPLPFRYAQHRSPIYRKLGASDPELQENKKRNLSLAAPRISGVLIRPGETFSFWRLVGLVTKRRGYREGMVLRRGEVGRDIGGGLCQLSNLLYWMALHTPLQVTERHHHSFDVFPDSGRTVPFGTGASVFSNYLDLRFKNPTSATFQILLEVTSDHLKGEIRGDRAPEWKYGIVERDHAFRYDAATGRYIRENKIFRVTRDAATGRVLGEKFLYANSSRTGYVPEGFLH